MPLFVVDVMGNMPGLPGLFVAGIFSASLSTISAAVNSLAAVTLEDYIKPMYLHFKKRPLPESNSTVQSKFIALTYGVICICVAFGARYLGGVLQASLTIFGVVGGPLFGLFTLGMFVPHANQRVKQISCKFYFKKFTKPFLCLFAGCFNWIGYGAGFWHASWFRLSKTRTTDSEFLR